MLPVDIGKDASRFDEHFAVSFHRKLCITDKGSTHPLPPSLGSFTPFQVADSRNSLLPEIRDWGDIFISLYERKAPWLGFHAAQWNTNALIEAAGGINTVSHQTDSGDMSNALLLEPSYAIEDSLADTEEDGIKITVSTLKQGRCLDSPPQQREEGPMRLAGIGAGMQRVRVMRIWREGIKAARCD